MVRDLSRRSFFRCLGALVAIAVAPVARPSVTWVPNAWGGFTGYDNAM